MDSLKEENKLTMKRSIENLKQKRKSKKERDLNKTSMSSIQSFKRGDTKETKGTRESTHSSNKKIKIIEFSPRYIKTKSSHGSFKKSKLESDVDFFRSMVSN